MKRGWRTFRRGVGSIRCEYRTGRAMRLAMMHTSNSVAQTEAVAGELARTLRGGEVIALYGELGAGKTQFTRGIVRALGGDARMVSSPTFVLLNVYDTPALKVFHLDAY